MSTRFSVPKFRLAACALALALAGSLTGGLAVQAQTATEEPTAEMNATAEATPLEMGMPNQQMAIVLDKLKAFNAPPIESTVPRIARELPTAKDAAMEAAAGQGKSVAPETVGSISHKIIPGPKDDLLIRIYTPVGDGPFPVIVYFHGGGWVIANLDTYDPSARALTNAAKAIVVSVAYRQAPENPFPAAADDAYAATQWVFDHASEFNGDPARVAVAGESAGGNLATVVTLMARDKGGKMPIYQLLVYPVTQLTNFETPSDLTYEKAAPLNTPMLKWFYDKYVPNMDDRTNPYASPLLADDLSGLPPATIIAAEIDPLLSDGQMYADKLKAAGVTVNYVLYPGVTHEFFGMAAAVDTAKEAQTQAAKDLDAAFGITS